MAKQIDTEEDARRLARAIASDLILYNDEKISAGADMSDEVAEGRALFERRTSEAFHELYDEVLASFGGQRRICYRAKTEGRSNEAERASSGAASDETEADGAPAAASRDSDPWGHDESGRAKAAAEASAPMGTSHSANRFGSFFDDGSAERDRSVPQPRPSGSLTRRSPLLTYALTAIVLAIVIYYLAR